MTDNAIYKSLQPGTILCGGKYTIEKKIGEGGFGITYKAVQNGLNRTVCIKEYYKNEWCGRATQAGTIYADESHQDLFERYRRAFVEEAQLLANLHHPGIVEVIDIFDENNTSYMVMNFIEGMSLQAMVAARGPLPFPEMVNYVAQVTDAVGYIHKKHILHRDIKPDNIMITADYKAILIDFGSARDFEQDKTQVHTVMLSQGYAPPEQAEKKSRKGAYTDIYAIGATMYFVLTGEVPPHPAARLIEALEPPKSLAPDIPDEANRTIMKAMQLKAENRHQTIQEFMDDLCNVKPSVLVDETIGGQPLNKDLNAEGAGNDGNGRRLGPFVAAVAGIVAALTLLVVLLFVPQKKKSVVLQRYDSLESLYENRTAAGNPENYSALLEAKSLLDSLNWYLRQYPFISRKRSVVSDNVLNEKLDNAQKAWLRSAKSQYEIADDVAAAISYCHIASFLNTTPEVVNLINEIAYNNSCPGAYMAVKKIAVKKDELVVSYDGLNQSELDGKIQYEICKDLTGGGFQSGTESMVKRGYVTVGIKAGNDNRFIFAIDGLSSFLPCDLSLSCNGIVFYRAKIGG